MAATAANGTSRFAAAITTAACTCGKERAHRASSSGRAGAAPADLASPSPSPLRARATVPSHRSSCLVCRQATNANRASTTEKGSVRLPMASAETPAHRSGDRRSTACSRKNDDAGRRGSSVGSSNGSGPFAICSFQKVICRARSDRPDEVLMRERPLCLLAVTMKSPITMESSPAARNVSIASVGVHTMGCPFTLNDVLSRIGSPDFAANASSNSEKRSFVARVTVWTRAVPSTWVTAGSLSLYADRTGTTKSICAISLLVALVQLEILRGAAPLRLQARTAGSPRASLSACSRAGACRPDADQPECCATRAREDQTPELPGTSP